MKITETIRKFQMFIFGYFATMPWEFITLHSSSSKKVQPRWLTLGSPASGDLRNGICGNLQLFFGAWKLLGAMSVSCQEGRIPPSCFFV